MQRCNAFICFGNVIKCYHFLVFSVAKNPSISECLALTNQAFCRRKAPCFVPAQGGLIPPSDLLTIISIRRKLSVFFVFIAFLMIENL